MLLLLGLNFLGGLAWAQELYRLPKNNRTWWVSFENPTGDPAAGTGLALYVYSQWPNLPWR